MDTKQRYEKIMRMMTPCDKALYYKDEIQVEMSQLKQVIVNSTYNEEHANNMRLGLCDVLEHLKRKNEEQGNVASEYIERLGDECRAFDTILGREKAGKTGEIQAFRSLETLKSEHVIFKNLELNIGDNRGELDAVVITSKAVFLIEVKNSGHDMVIDSKGNYFRARGYMNMDYNIGEKVNNKEYLLRNVISKEINARGKKLKIVNYVVFPNRQIDGTNQYKYLKTCFLSQLPHLIDEYEGEELYTSGDLQDLRELITNSENKKAYPLGMDIDKLKSDFAMTMALLEVAGGYEPEIEQTDTEKCEEKQDEVEKARNSNSLIFIGAAVTIALSAVASTIIRKK